MKPTDKKLYNFIVLPFWMMVWVPPLGLLAIPLKIGFFRLVLRHILNKHHVLRSYSKRLLFQVLGISLLADLFGAFLLFLPQLLPWSLLGLDRIAGHFLLTVLYDPFANLPSLLWVLGAMVLTSCLIYWMNLKFTFRQLEARKRLALHLALWTAPILFLLPTRWFGY